jgi:hypothetical protein
VIVKVLQSATWNLSGGGGGKYRGEKACDKGQYNNNNKWKELGIKLDNGLGYEHVPKSVETSQVGKVTILWNQQVQTDRTIPNNKPGHHNPG